MQYFERGVRAPHRESRTGAREVEPELAFADIWDDMQCAEDFLKFCAKSPAAGGRDAFQSRRIVLGPELLQARQHARVQPEFLSTRTSSSLLISTRERL